MSPTLGRVEDWIAINELLARYAHAFDAGDADAWLGCFTSSGVLTARGRSIEGHSALREHILKSAARPRHRHVVANVVIAFGEAPAKAEAASYTFYYEETGGAFVLQFAGSQQDELVKVDGAWQIASRRIEGA